jgi:hypothetical protein
MPTASTKNATVWELLEASRDVLPVVLLRRQCSRSVVAGIMPASRDLRG